MQTTTSRPASGNSAPADIAAELSPQHRAAILTAQSHPEFMLTAHGNTLRALERKGLCTGVFSCIDGSVANLTELGNAVFANLLAEVTKQPETPHQGADEPLFGLRVTDQVDHDAGALFGVEADMPTDEQPVETPAATSEHFAKYVQASESRTIGNWLDAITSDIRSNPAEHDTERNRQDVAYVMNVLHGRALALNEQRAERVRALPARNRDLPVLTIQELNRTYTDLVERLADYSGIHEERLRERLVAVMDELHGRALAEERRRQTVRNVLARQDDITLSRELGAQTDRPTWQRREILNALHTRALREQPKPRRNATITDNARAVADFIDTHHDLGEVCSLDSQAMGAPLVKMQLGSRNQRHAAATLLAWFYRLDNANVTRTVYKGSVHVEVTGNVDGVPVAVFTGFAPAAASAALKNQPTVHTLRAMQIAGVR
ncbi:hypothetical protein [Kibdelosporangium phytohabitans]|uniref:Uncharacterized protein n=1 Tax=Kibdelosporangium phytohabitans TaxID=860235 RepID=A0A0N7F356_9PSEU|nr:hypothetical protein [Kibdelosporangium phytohabitans]ALG07639.1 hypothetical protein AOZ06_12630 [Kibdelosporangium phytohabitans]ALG07695.1 hypothetical protein AOZ06_12950 [Kibdelosporangium phytohabitans]MBE1471407.1 hypothetical protein [Kibdelosporangium phytohabitans]